MNRLSAMSPPSADRILFLGKRFYTNKDALAERFGRVYQLPALWAARGCAVLLWLVDYHTRESAEQAAGALQIRSTPVFSLAPLRALAAVARFRPTIVVAAGDCYVGLLGWLLARLGGARFVFDIYDKYDEFAGYRRPFGLDLFAFLRRRADLRLYCSHGLRDFYAAEDASAPSAIVRNGVDDQAFRHQDRKACRATLGLPADEILVGYFGSMEPDRGVGDLLAAMEILRQQGRPLRLLICGRSDPALDLDRDWILFRGMVAHEQMPMYLNACDLLVIPYRESAIMDMGASCKIAEYILCERPMVSTSTGNFVSNFPVQAVELGLGMCRPGDVPGLARAIEFQLNEQRILSTPTDMGWSHIAGLALEAMRSFPKEGK